MWTVSLDAQVLENNICLTAGEIDYFLNQDLNAKALAIDTVLMSIKIKRQDSINKLMKLNLADLENNEIDLKSSLNNQKIVTNVYKDDLYKIREKYDKKAKWNNIWKKTIIVTVIVIIVESSIIYLKTK